MQSRPPRSAPISVHVRAAGGTGAGASDLFEYVSGRRPSLEADAEPVRLHAIVGEVAPRMSRMASRFAQLAVLGASSCLRRLDIPPQPGTRVYLGTGLGDIGATDALCYSVMPPAGESASPARFVTSGNNIAAFFVAQYAQLTSRNLSVSQAELSFECALDLALSDLSAGAADCALVGGVDETTLPREFYTRRFMVAPDQPIGEGSGWLLLDSGRTNANLARAALGAISGVRLLPPPLSTDAALWADQVVAAMDDLGLTHLASGQRAESAGGSPECATRLTLMAGCGVGAADFAVLAARLPACEHLDYLPYTGRFPTAAALGVAGLFARQWPRSQTCLHVNRDGSGRTGLVALEVYAS
jgi:Beta-ketoacyl synthase, N-terminal domain